MNPIGKEFAKDLMMKMIEDKEKNEVTYKSLAKFAFSLARGKNKNANKFF